MAKAVEPPAESQMSQFPPPMPKPSKKSDTSSGAGQPPGRRPIPTQTPSPAAAASKVPEPVLTPAGGPPAQPAQALPEAPAQTSEPSGLAASAAPTLAVAPGKADAPAIPTSPATLLYAGTTQAEKQPIATMIDLNDSQLEEPEELIPMQAVMPGAAEVAGSDADSVAARMAELRHLL